MPLAAKFTRLNLLRTELYIIKHLMARIKQSGLFLRPAIRLFQRNSNFSGDDSDGKISAIKVLAQTETRVGAYMKKIHRSV